MKNANKKYYDFDDKYENIDSMYINKKSNLVKNYKPLGNTFESRKNSRSVP